MQPALPYHQYIDHLYRLVLGRAADPGGLSYWLTQIEATGDPTIVLKALLASPEYSANFFPTRSRPDTDLTAGPRPIELGKIGGLYRDRNDALPAALELIVPVCNAEGWISEIYAAYRNAGISPLFIVETRSNDRSLDILTERNARVFTATGEHPYVESLLCDLLPYFESEWVLRLDDDELPSTDLLRWIAETLPLISEPVVSLNVEWVQQEPVPGSPIWNCSAADGTWTSMRWARLFRPAKVRPIPDLHTAGISYATEMQAPNEFAINHLSWIVRDLKQRLAKIERYEEQGDWRREGTVQFYLPEEKGSEYYIKSVNTDDILRFACDQLIVNRSHPQ